ncbi:hypothetical protein [Chryseobacterium sp. BIGb0232]|uniref:hypothetical protein n=1 Tax=Chryseobacterium sp. BIGb0232 TaxID=2940598 RepID=UPI000F48FB3F|nr:hypothetical protein [Chryseobacterium sp. BIGb0232]MCS4305597.1 lipopolysaccharide export LptBFGC system permease protein LptF [Chryseobacterium sp. BIGb0232]ROS20791.1 hypothetical protein EDF65_1524 [Chryseobacterium nakagawai]
MKKILFASTFVLSLLSCKENKPQNKPVIENAIDNAESSVSGSFESYRGDNLIDNTYSELIRNDKSLKLLDDKIIKTQQETGKTLEVYDKIISTSESFYLQARNRAKSITDSLTKQQVEKEIKASADQYNIKIRDVNLLIAQVNKNNTELNNLYTAFKLRKTLTEIEKYQNAHPLKTDSLNQLINRQNKLLEELKKLK